MKLKDWYNFNFGNDQFKCTIGDIYVKVFRKESYKNEAQRLVEFQFWK